MASIGAYAQGTVVTGLVNDSVSGEGEIAAIVQFFKADSTTPYVYTTTDMEGKFSIRINAKGDFTLNVSNLGRKTVTKDFTLNGEETLDLGIILMEDDVQMLDEGKVVALRNLVKMDVDKITYKVEDDIDAKTFTLLDMLRKVPMVVVDAQDNITVNGSSSFQVLLDGKPNVMMSSNPSLIFKSMPASFAKSVEVITNPGVKYDAEGVGGVLNIITNKAALAGQQAVPDGYNASLGTTFTTRGLMGTAFASGQKGKLSYSANVSAMNMTIPGSVTDVMREQLQDGNLVSMMNSHSDATLKTPTRVGTVSLGYDIDSLRLVSATVGFTGISSKSSSNDQITMAMGGQEFGYSSKTNSIWDINNISGSVDYQRSFKDNPYKNFTLSYQFASSPSVTDSKSLFSNASGSMFDLTDRYTDGSTNTIQNTVQADYTTRTANGITIDLGAKYINRLNKSDQAQFLGGEGNWVENTSGSLIYRHNNHIGAAYAEAAYTFGKVSGKGGLRYEHTFLDVNYKKGNGSNFALNYGNLVPAVSLQYSLSQFQNVGVSYNMRISRPGITYLNPYVDISNPTSISYGNTHLETEKAHNLGLVYNLVSNKVVANFNLNHNWTPNAISSYSFFDANGLLNTTYGNITQNRSTSLNGMFVFSLGNKTRLILNGGGSYISLNSEVLGLRNSGWSSNMLASLQQTLPWNIIYSGALIWTSRTISVDGYNDGISIAQSGLTKTFLGDRLTVSLTGVAPITLKDCIVRTSETQGKDYKMLTISKIPMRQALLSIRWSFGSNSRASVKKTKVTINNDDLMDRDNGAKSMNSMMGM